MARLARVEVFAPDEIAIVHALNHRDTHKLDRSAEVW